MLHKEHDDTIHIIKHNSLFATSLYNYKCIYISDNKNEQGHEHYAFGYV